MEDLKKAIEEILADDIVKIVISNKMKKDFEYNKINISLKETKNKSFYQVEKFTDKQVFHENLSKEELKERLIHLVFNNYKNLNAWSKNSTYDLKISKKGKIFLGKKGGDNSKIASKASSHNKEKNYILKEGMIIEPLIDLGVFSKEGKVINSKYDKYKQINRFVEIVDDEIKKNDFKELTILDFGCGKSYLTFVLYYYFVKIKNIKVKMIGLDLKKDVIEKCNKIAEGYGYDNLHFELGDINGFKYENKVDMVITLHACDTATDYALYNAVKWNAKMIFSVPCCQHEFNSQMDTDTFSIISKYGIIKERMAALMTDAVRGNLLEAAGYKTQLLEFIDIAHSPKNILIRASKGGVSKAKKEKAIEEVNNLVNEFNFKPTLLKLLQDDKIID
ncbi:class I SAM-dependent methyltransferase [Clostridium thermobutyricum]|uniref:Methyltransferase domain protein n=1 Tax=Clostridium thermobutyricum DSM 4928 TaxID=1121339 RepID=A0A1V4SUF0_9CLOT|nr:SAM-dependent methyltransferase [Clostridium thermobutyricum]OPX47492.1 methyltransferase domain protein [Clostridium thermobutyricum DSM 4928]